ncbi:CCE_0567 family metalloprotein [Gloeocapsa sp. BRSZ]
MLQATATEPTAQTIEDLKLQIKRLNSKAGQMKMDLHDLAEGLPKDYQQLTTLAAQTYEIYHQLHELKSQLKDWEKKL